MQKSGYLSPTTAKVSETTHAMNASGLTQEAGRWVTGILIHIQAYHSNVSLSENCSTARWRSSVETSEIVILLLGHQEQKIFSSQQCSHPCSRDMLSQPPPIYPLGDHSCLTAELYRDHVRKDEEICSHTVTYVC